MKLPPTPFRSDTIHSHRADISQTRDIHKSRWRSEWPPGCPGEALPCLGLTVSSTCSKALLSALGHSGCATLPFQNQERQPKEITAGRGSPGAFGQWAGSACILQKFTVKNWCLSIKTVAEAESFGSEGWILHYSRNKMRKTTWSETITTDSKDFPSSTAWSCQFWCSQWWAQPREALSTEFKAFHILCSSNWER